MKSLQTSMACALAFLLMTTSFETNAASTLTSSATSNEVWSVFDRFAKEKHALAEDLAKRHKMEMPAQAEEFFASAQKRDWNTSSNLFRVMAEAKRSQTDQWTLSELWSPVLDTYGAYELFHAVNPKFLKMLGADMVKDIPNGSLYFGGTDPGCFLVSAFSQSHTEGRPFFTVTQNRLSDPGYLAYVADIYGNRIGFADTNDFQVCYSNYKADAKARLLHDKEFPNQKRQVRPGEDVHLDDAGNLQMSGQISVVAVRALLAKVVFDKNPTKEFYVEESFPLDWMFPHLTPFGAIMKLNRAEIPDLTEEVLKQDHEFWARYSEGLVGNWITYETSVKDVAAFVERVYLNHDYSGFQGDVDFIRDEAAQKAFSKLRSSIGGIYCWRLGQPPSGGAMPDEFIAKGPNRKLIEREADYAFKQAWALRPGSSEAIYRYIQLLVTLGRVDDALLIAETGKKIDPENKQLDYLIQNLKTMKGRTISQADVQSEIAPLEKAVDANPTNIMQQFELAQKFVQAGQREKAYKVLDDILAFSDVTVPEVISLADAFNKLNQPKRLEAALGKLTELKPDSPEAWYDLAAVRATIGQTEPAVEALKKSIDLNDKRLAQDSKAKDVRTTLGGDARFSKLRETQEFKALMTKP